MYVRQTLTERRDEIARKLFFAPVEQQVELEKTLEAELQLQIAAETLGKEWQVTAQFAYRFLQLEAQVAALKS